LKEEPISTKAAACTILPNTGIRYSKFPKSSCVSPPIRVQMRLSFTTLLPVGPVNNPTLASEAGKPVFAVAVAVPCVDRKTPRVVR
jgi:hypothetical protein